MDEKAAEGFFFCFRAVQLEGIRSRDSAFRCNCGDPCLFGNGKDTGISVPLGADKAADKNAGRKEDGPRY